MKSLSSLSLSTFNKYMDLKKIHVGGTETFGANIIFQNTICCHSNFFFNSSQALKFYAFKCVSLWNRDLTFGDMSEVSITTR